jgi:hypothetical protein
VAWWQKFYEVTAILNIIIVLCLIFGYLEPLGVKYESLLLFGEEKRE